MIDKKRVARLGEYVEGIFNKEDRAKFYLAYKDDLEKISPQECFEIFALKLDQAYSPRQILESLDRIINAFYDSLTRYQWTRPEKDSFLDIMMRENRAFEEKLNEIKLILREKRPEVNRTLLIEKIRELESFDDHYLKKENILFPYLEKKAKKFEGITIMWSLQDLARQDLKDTLTMLKEDQLDLAKFNPQIGRLFFTLMGLVMKEELILFPAATEVLSKEDFEEMNLQSLDYNFPFIERPPIKRTKKEAEGLVDMRFKTPTGELNFEELRLILSHLPVDFTYVDENDRVRYFSDSKERLFPRSPAVIGREVKFCHPSESLQVVEEIINKFKSGQEETASFWLNLNDKKILIQYFALRNNQGHYKGVLEVSQDISLIQGLRGEKRLLSWE